MASEQRLDELHNTATEAMNRAATHLMKVGGNLLTEAVRLHQAVCLKRPCDIRVELLAAIALQLGITQEDLLRLPKHLVRLELDPAGTFPETTGAAPDPAPEARAS